MRQFKLIGTVGGAIDAVRFAADGSLAQAVSQACITPIRDRVESLYQKAGAASPPSGWLRDPAKTTRPVPV